LQIAEGPSRVFSSKKAEDEQRDFLKLVNPLLFVLPIIWSRPELDEIAIQYLSSLPAARSDDSLSPKKKAQTDISSESKRAKS
jgi:hypothetical protein